MLGKRKIFLTLLAGLFLITLSTLVWAGEFTAFGPQDYVRETGKPVTVTNNFSVLNPDTEYILRVYNGGLENADTELVSSTIIVLNGTEILGPQDFNQTVKFLEIPVTLQLNNTIEVEARGKPGGLLTIQTVGIDNESPEIFDFTPADGAVLEDSLPTISANYTDTISGINISAIRLIFFFIAFA